ALSRHIGAIPTDPLYFPHGAPVAPCATMTHPLTRLVPLFLIALLAAPQLACSKTASAEDDKSSSKKDKKKHKPKSADDDDDEEDDEPKAVEVPNSKGFVVPPGGLYHHNSAQIGDVTLVFETYEYPTSEFPRAKLRKSFGEFAKKAGWKLQG